MEQEIERLSEAEWVCRAEHCSTLQCPAPAELSVLHPVPCTEKSPAEPEPAPRAACCGSTAASDNADYFLRSNGNMASCQRR